jgi:hypothetical protein
MIALSQALFLLTGEDIRENDMELNQEAVGAQLASLLRDQPRGTTANLTDFAVAYWDGHRVVYVFLDEHHHAALDDEFDLTDYLLNQWKVDFEAWFAEPHYSVRPELLKWLKADA